MSFKTTFLSIWILLWMQSVSGAAGILLEAAGVVPTLRPYGRFVSQLDKVDAGAGGRLAGKLYFDWGVIFGREAFSLPYNISFAGQDSILLIVASYNTLGYFYEGTSFTYYLEAGFNEKASVSTRTALVGGEGKNREFLDSYMYGIGIHWHGTSNQWLGLMLAARYIALKTSDLFNTKRDFNGSVPSVSLGIVIKI